MLLEGENVLLIAKDNYLRAGASEIQKFTVGCLTIRAPSSGLRFPAMFGAKGSNQHRKGLKLHLNLFSATKFGEISVQSRGGNIPLRKSCFQVARQLSSLKRGRKNGRTEV